MNKTLKSIITYTLMVALGALMLWLTFKDTNPEYIWGKIKGARFFWVFLSAVFSFIAFISRAYRWNMLLHPTGYRPLLSNTSYAVMFGYLANLAFPRLGEVSRCGSLSKKEKIPFDVLIGTVIVERIIDVLSLVIAIGIVMLLEFNTIGNFLYSFVFAKLGTLITMRNMAIVVVALTILVVVLKKILRNSAQSGAVYKIKKTLAGIGTGLQTVRKIKNLPLFLFHSIFIWLMYYLMIYVCFFSLDATSTLGIRECFLILVAGGIGMSAPAPGGFGTYHTLVSQGLALYGVPIDDGVTFATLLHSSQIVEIALCGFAALVIMNFTPDRDSKIV